MTKEKKLKRQQQVVEPEAVSFWRSAGLAVFCVSVVSAVVACLVARPWTAGLTEDGGHFLLMARLGAEGMLPHRDLFSQQTPLHLWLLSIAWSVGGRTAVVLVGLLSVAALTAAGGFVVLSMARRPVSFVGGLCVGGAVWATGPAFNIFGLFLTAGGRPKQLATLFALLAVLTITRRWFRLAGCLLCAAIWTWQPAVVIGIAVVAPLAIVAGTRDLRGLSRVVAGGALFSVLPVGVLILQGAFTKFVEQAIVFPMTYARPYDSDVAPSFSMVAIFLPPPHLFVAVVAVVWALMTILRGRKERIGSYSETAARWGVIFWIVAMLGLLAFRFDGRADLIPLLLPVATLIGWCLLEALPRFPGSPRLVLATGLAFWLSVFFQRSWPSAEEQRSNARSYLDLADGGNVLIFADPLSELFSDRDPYHPYVYWEPGTFDFVQEREEGGMSGFLSRMNFEHEFEMVILGKRGKALLPILRRELGPEFRFLEEQSTRSDRAIWIRERKGS